MAASLELTDYDPVLKEHYVSHRLLRMAYEDNPFLALIPKWTKFTGRNFPMPFQYGVAAGVSADFETAQSNAAPGSYEAWLLTRKSYYSTATIKGEVMAASEDDPGAFVDAATTEIDGAIHACTRRLAVQLPGNGGGALAQVGSTSTVTLTLKDINQIVNFELNQTLDSSSTDGTSGSADGGSKQVTGIDDDAGTLTAATNWTSAGNFSNDDYIFIKGDFGNCISGIDSWVPSSAPSATPWYGVVRTAHKTKLGGIRFDGTPYNMHDAFVRAAQRHRRGGGKLTHWFTNGVHYTDLELTLEGKVQHDIVKSQDGNFGFTGLKLSTPQGTSVVVADDTFKPGVAYGVPITNLKLASLGDAPRILDHDNKGMMLRQGTKDGVEVRIGYYANFGIYLPGHCIRVGLST